MLNILTRSILSGFDSLGKSRQLRRNSHLKVIQLISKQILLSISKKNIWTDFKSNSLIFEQGIFGSTQKK